MIDENRMWQLTIAKKRASDNLEAGRAYINQLMENKRRLENKIAAQLSYNMGQQRIILACDRGTL